MKNFFLPAATLWWRELIRFLRQRSRVGAALGTPLLFWLFLGSGIGSSFRSDAAPGGMNYLEYFYPGTLILVILFTSIFSSISLIEDRKEGFLLSVLVAPVSRSGPVFGKILGGATLAFLQGFIFILLAPLVGIPLTLGKIPLLAGVVFLNAFALTSLGFAFAWQIDSTQGFHGVMNMVLFPMWLLSGALFPAAGASAWVQWTMFLNPLTYGLAALQAVFYGPGSGLTATLPSLLVSVSVITLFGLAAFLAAFQLAQRSTAKGVA